MMSLRFGPHLVRIFGAFLDNTRPPEKFLYHMDIHRVLRTDLASEHDIN